MAVTHDYGTVPTKLKITNTAVSKLATDAGTRKVFEVIPVADMIEGEEFTPVAFNATTGALEYVQVARKYTVSDRFVQFYLTNTGIVLASGDSVIVNVPNTPAFHHYMSLAEDGITVEAVTEAGGSEDTEKP